MLNIVSRPQARRNITISHGTLLETNRKQHVKDLLCHLVIQYTAFKSCIIYMHLLKSISNRFIFHLVDNFLQYCLDKNWSKHARYPESI